MIDLVVVVVLAVAGFIGWRRGTLSMASPVAGVVAGYAAAGLFYRPLGSLVAAATNLPPLVAYPLGGMAAFFVASTVARFIVRRVTRKAAAATTPGAAPAARSTQDRLGGAALGVATAGALAVVVLWAIAGVRAVSGSGPDVSQTLAGRITAGTSRRVAQAAIARITGERLFSSALGLMASDPKGGTATVQTIAENAQLKRLLSDPTVMESLRRNDAASLARNDAMVALAGDERFRDAVAQLGVLPAGSDAKAMAGAMVMHVGPVVRTMDELKTDPEVRRMLEGDQGIAARFQSGDAAGLLTDPEFNRLASRVLETMRKQRAPR